MNPRDMSKELQERVAHAHASGTALSIRGGGTKNFLGQVSDGEHIDVSGHRGIVNYEPTELVITARAGTSLRDIEATLAAHNQMLVFEPPHFGAHATLGGTIACNLSGPRRAYAGAARDFVLGTKLINGKGEILSFGGEVMKNVAGYDVSRLMAGAMGTLGVLLNISLKVLPRPEVELTLVYSNLSTEAALEKLHAWGAQPLPVTGSCYHEGRCIVRLSGSSGAVAAAHYRMGGDVMERSAAESFWLDLKEHRHAFFTDPRPLWRLSVASDCPPMALEGLWLHEWGGAQRWLISPESPERVRAAAEKAGGHATLYRNAREAAEAFHPLAPSLLGLHHRLKQAFDPKAILNPGRLYARL